MMAEQMNYLKTIFLYVVKDWEAIREIWLTHVLGQWAVGDFLSFILCLYS